MAQKDRIVGLDISKLKVDGCIRSLEMRLEAPSTAEGHAQLVSWLGVNGVGLAVMEASGGYERSWARALSAAGIAVWIVDPKRGRHFAKSAGRVGKKEAIRAEKIARDAKTLPGPPPAAR